MSDNQNNKFTVEAALLAKKNGTLSKWTQELLQSEGGVGLANALKSERTVAVEMLNFPLSLLKKIEGPEEQVENRLSPDVWEKNVQRLTDLIKHGYSPAPLIVTDFWNKFEIADGNHRHEALVRAGIKSYWTIFFIKHPAGQKYILDIVKNNPA